MQYVSEEPYVPGVLNGFKWVLLITPLNETWPVAYRSREHAAINKIKLLVEHPGVFQVVNEEADIYRNARNEEGSAFVQCRRMEGATTYKFG